MSAGQRRIRLTAFITKQDEDHMDPKIYVEQRVYEGVIDKTIVHELAFGGRIKLDKEYEFLACGDEDRILGKRDLMLRIVSVSDILNYLLFRINRSVLFSLIRKASGTTCGVTRHTTVTISKTTYT